MPVVDNVPGSITKVGVAASRLELSLSFNGIKVLCNTNCTKWNFSSPA